MSDTSNKGQWLTVEEAAERVRVNSRTIWRWGQCGLRICKRGRVSRIWSPHLDAFMRGDS